MTSDSNIEFNLTLLNTIDSADINAILCEIATGLVLPWTDITDTNGTNCLAMLP